VSRDELIEGAVAVAAPFFDGADQVAGSLGNFGPACARVAQVERFASSCGEAARLSKALASRALARANSNQAASASR
jgi:DNA-binding IclR family transcriptional regulator